MLEKAKSSIFLFYTCKRYPHKYLKVNILLDAHENIRTPYTGSLLHGIWVKGKLFKHFMHALHFFNTKIINVIYFSKYNS